MCFRDYTNAFDKVQYEEILGILKKKLYLIREDIRGSVNVNRGRLQKINKNKKRARSKVRSLNGVI